MQTDHGQSFRAEALKPSSGKYVSKINSHLLFIYGGLSVSKKRILILSIGRLYLASHRASLHAVLPTRHYLKPLVVSAPDSIFKDVSDLTT